MAASVLSSVNARQDYNGLKLINGFKMNNK
jgi:hypothetical protein